MDSPEVPKGLRYVRDDEPGLTRLGVHPRFRYVDAERKPVRDPVTLARIRSLVIPPAWTAVWICKSPSGHIQATGRDARGRKQYRYHPAWREHQDANKFARVLEFGRALPKIRSRIDEDLARPGLPREKVLAAVVRLLELTHIRVGNEEYARTNRSYGLTTLESRHVAIAGDTVKLSFRGKSGKHHVLGVRAPRVARVIRRCEELPGQQLFEYLDEAGEARAIASHDVNEYIRAAAGEDFSAKDFRTLAGTVLAARALRALPRCTSKAEVKRVVKSVVTVVAERLGNTVTVCRRCYIHPVVLDAYERSLLGEDEADTTKEEASVLRLVARFTLEEVPNLVPARPAAAPSRPPSKAKPKKAA